MNKSCFTLIFSVIVILQFLTYTVQNKQYQARIKFELKTSKYISK